MIHGATFGDVHSLRDLGLYTKKITVNPPKPKTLYVDVPGADGQIDLTESLTGQVVYQARTIRFEFLVIGGKENWPTVYSTVLNHLHGKQKRIVLDADKQHYYTGRCVVNKWQCDQAMATLVIDATCDPYKYAVDGGEKSL